jgi:hypothetical protein
VGPAARFPSLSPFLLWQTNGISLCVAIFAMERQPAQHLASYGAGLFYCKIALEDGYRMGSSTQCKQPKEPDMVLPYLAS